VGIRIGTTAANTLGLTRRSRPDDRDVSTDAMSVRARSVSIGNIAMLG
jgi:hypothetical protein